MKVELGKHRLNTWRLSFILAYRMGINTLNYSMRYSCPILFTVLVVGVGSGLCTCLIIFLLHRRDAYVYRLGWIHDDLFTFRSLQTG